MISERIRSLGRISPRFPPLIEFGLLTCLWTVSVAIVNPVGEFAIIDDGLYESIVKHLLATGQFPNPEPASATLLTNIYWGAAFSLLKGVSFTTLRMSTLLASLLGLFGISVLARDLGIPVSLRFLVVLTIAFSPAYHALSYSFMTDVPFAALVIWASVFFVRSVNSNSLVHLGLATALTVVATLSRQVALAMPIAYGIGVFFKEGMHPSFKTCLRALIPILIPAVALKDYFYVMASTHRLPITYNFFSNIMLSTLTHGSALRTVPFVNVYITVLYLGLFLLPVLLATTGGLSRYRSTPFWLFFIFSLALAIAGALIRLRLGLSNVVPLPESHVLVPPGIGLLWLRGGHSVAGLSPEFWSIVTSLGALGSLLLLAQLSATARDLTGFVMRKSLSTAPQVGTLYLLVTGIILLGPYLFTGASDRYLIPALPLLAVAMASASLWSPQEPSPILVVSRTSAPVLLFGAVAFSVIGTRDYLEWHRISAAASTALIDDHIRPQRIDGGEEFNAYYPAYQGHENEIDFSDLESDPSGYIFTDEIKRQGKVVERVAWRPPTVEYIVGFEPIPGYSIIQEYSYYNWMPPHRQKILVLSRN